METITVQPVGNTDIGAAIATVTQLKAAGLVQGHEITNDGIVVHLWPATANRVEEMGGFDAYVAALETQFKAKGLKRVPSPEEKAKAGAVDKALRTAEAMIAAEKKAAEERQRIADEKAAKTPVQP